MTCANESRKLKMESQLPNQNQPDQGATTNFSFFPDQNYSLESVRKVVRFLLSKPENIPMHIPIPLEMGSPFNAGSFSPATCLTEDLPQGVDADVLLLGAEDARHILYTTYAELGFPERKFDITVVDETALHIARNILLFTMILDKNTEELLAQLSLVIDGNKGSEPVTSSRLWNVYHNLYLDDADIALVGSQATKLVGMSQSLDIWHANAYGDTLRFCDEGTLELVRSIWAKYAAGARKKDSNTYKDDFRTRLNEARAKVNPLRGSKKAVSRSCAPLGMQMADDLLVATEQHWETGLSVPLPVNGQGLFPNPAFAASLTGSSILKYPTDPLLGFHLAAAQAKLTEDSPLRLEENKLSNAKVQERLLKMARLQFEQWTEAFRAASPRMTIRFVASDTFALCYTLRHNVETSETTAHWYSGKLGFAVLNLAESEYGQDAEPAAPKQFDVIHTFNLSDQVGPTNLLVAAGPLLKDAPSPTLYTEGIEKIPIQPEWQIEQLLCGHTTTISMLLGLVPITTWTNATTISAAEEIMMDASGAADAMKQRFTSRLAWKQTKHISGQPASLRIDGQELVNLARSIYYKLFERKHTGDTVKPEDVTKVVPKKGWRVQHHMGTFSAVLKAICERTRVDSPDLCLKLVAFFKAIAEDGRSRSKDARVHELFLTMTDGPSMPEFPTDKPCPLGFAKWAHIPWALAVTLVVPANRWRHVADVHEKKQLTALVEAHVYIPNPSGGNPARSTYSDIQISFGVPITYGSPDKDNFRVTVKEDQKGWLGTSPMILSFYVSTQTLRTAAFVPGGRIGIHYAETKFELDGLEEATGEMLSDFVTKITDTENVFITRYRPNHTGHPITERGFDMAKEARKAVANASTKTAAATVASTAATPSPEPWFIANLLPVPGHIVSITGHLDITSDRGKQLLADKVPITLHQTSPFSVNITLGTTADALTLPLTFPAPITVEGSKNVVARKTGFVEITAPLAHALMSPHLDNFLFPTTLTPGANTPTTVLPNLSLSTLPTLSPAAGADGDLSFLTTHTSLTFTPRERALRSQATAASGFALSPRLNLKESIFTLFMLASGLQGGQGGSVGNPTQVFLLMCIDGVNTINSVHALVFVNAVRLDGAHGGVVADAAVLPLTKAVVEDKKMCKFLTKIKHTDCCKLKVNHEELELWKKMLPGWVERCREWEHDKEKCEYVTGGKVPVGLGDGEKVLCSCGQGKLPKKFVALPGWEVAAQYATRAAISPVFAEGLIEELVDAEWVKKKAAEARVRTCWACGKVEGAGVQLKKCARCFVATYCSAECQKNDWKTHRVDCQKPKAARGNGADNGKVDAKIAGTANGPVNGKEDAKGDTKVTGAVNDKTDVKGDTKVDGKINGKADAKGDAKAEAKGDAKTDAKVVGKGRGKANGKK